MTPYSDLVTRLWRLCSLLRKDGVTYPQYVTELTYLIFLKLASERQTENLAIPEGHRWSDLLGSEDNAILDRYRQTLAILGMSRHSRTMQAVFAGAVTVVRDPATLRRLVNAIDDSDWFSDERDAFGDAYEGLLQKNAEETKRGAGQYFTPRVLVDCIVSLLKPRPGEIVQDPAAGTGGFLIAADRALRADWRGPKEALVFQRTRALRGVENVLDTYRLLCMNLYLHGIESEHVLMGDTLSQLGASPEFQNTDVILSNPPFGPAGGVSSREDLSITAKSGSFQLPFVEHCMRALAPGGRAAVVVPDNVLFEGGEGQGTASGTDAGFQSAHDLAPAHRDLLRPRGQNQCALLQPAANITAESSTGPRRPSRANCPTPKCRLRKACASLSADAHYAHRQGSGCVAIRGSICRCPWKAFSLPFERN